MSRLRHWTFAGVLALCLAGCASAPVHYYTLTTQGLPAGRVAPAPYPFELSPVGVPAQVDVPQLVVRTGGQGMQLLDGRRWIAPLGDEIRGTLSSDLANALGVADMSGLPDSGQPRLRITFDVRRFESVPDDHVLIEAAWSLRLTGAADGRRALSCVSVDRETVGAGYDALVAGHQQALASIASRIAAAARAYEAGNRAACPSD